MYSLHVHVYIHEQVHAIEQFQNNYTLSQHSDLLHATSSLIHLIVQ